MLESLDSGKAITWMKGQSEECRSRSHQDVGVVGLEARAHVLVELDLEEGITVEALYVEVYIGPCYHLTTLQGYQKIQAEVGFK